MIFMLCGGYVCKYVIKLNGIYFVGFEMYYLYNILLRFMELVRFVEKFVELWKVWFLRQLKVLRVECNCIMLSDDKDYDDDDKEKDDQVQNIRKRQKK